MHMVAGTIAEAVGVAFFLYATVGRFLKLHRPCKWANGGEVTIIGEIAISTSCICFGLILLFSPAFFIPFACALIIAIASGIRSQWRFFSSERAVRAANKAIHPGVFDQTPPTNLGQTNCEMFDLYDVGTCAYMGKAKRSDIQILLNALRKLFDIEDNDIFLMVDMLGDLGTIGSRSTQKEL
jgi:hypothetical protein